MFVFFNSVWVVPPGFTLPYFLYLKIPQWKSGGGCVFSRWIFHVQSLVRYMTMTTTAEGVKDSGKIGDVVLCVHFTLLNQRYRALLIIIWRNTMPNTHAHFLSSLLSLYSSDWISSQIWLKSLTNNVTQYPIDILPSFFIPFFLLDSFSFLSEYLSFT